MRAVLLVAFVAGFSLAGLAQAPLHQEAGGPFVRPPIIDAPFSADATTTIRQTRNDGTVVEWTTRARYYRDGAGRVRVDQTIWNPDARDSKVKTTVQHEMESGTVYVMEPSTKTTRRIPRGLGDMEVGGGHSFSVPTSFNTLLTTSRRLPTAVIDNVEVDPGLKLVTYSRHLNPSRGIVVEYRVSNINRAEPSADLFAAPPDDYASVPIGGVSFHFPQQDLRPKTRD